MSNASIAILGLVNEKPRYGYQIEQVIEERGMRDWTEIGFSSIYYLLKKLESQGLIQGWLSHNEQGPARKIYHISKAGRAYLKDAIYEALSIPKRCILPIQVGLSELPCLEQAEARQALQQYRYSLEERLNTVRMKKARQPDLPYHVKGQFDHSISLISAELEWLTVFMESMEAAQERILLNNNNAFAGGE